MYILMNKKAQYVSGITKRNLIVYTNNINAAKLFDSIISEYMIRLQPELIRLEAVEERSIRVIE